MKAWHFTDDKLRDGRPTPAPGVKLVHHGHLLLCHTGYHASVRIIDALQYAPGNIVHRVEVGGDIIRSGDKLVASERTILWSLNASEVLRHFARLCALDIIHLWDAPAIVAEFLKTGDETLRDAAWAAAWYAARDAAWAAAWAAARDAARDAAWYAARDAAWAAAWDAARDAARDAAWYAARDAARAKQNKRLVRMVSAAHKK